MPPAWFQADEAVPHLATLSAAVWDGPRVAIDYDRGDEVVPSGRSVRSGSCSRAGSGTSSGVVDGQIRTYRASRVVGARRARTSPSSGPTTSTSPRTGRSRAPRTSATTPRVDGRSCASAEDQLWRINDVFGRGTVEPAERARGARSDRARSGCGCASASPTEVPGLLLAVGPNLEVARTARGPRQGHRARDRIGSSSATATAAPVEAGR